MSLMRHMLPCLFLLLAVNAPTFAVPPEGVAIAGARVPNIEVLDQLGKTHRLHDLVRGRVVALNFIYTTCPTICAPMGANFVQLKNRLAPHLGKELVMLTISVDPVHDTPERLRAWSEQFKPGPGWTLLTGGAQEIYQLLKALKVYTPDKENLAPIILMGTEGKDGWTRTHGLTDVGKLEQTLRGYLNGGQPRRE